MKRLLLLMLLILIGSVPVNAASAQFQCTGGEQVQTVPSTHQLIVKLIAINHTKYQIGVEVGYLFFGPSWNYVGGDEYGLRGPSTVIGSIYRERTKYYSMGILRSVIALAPGQTEYFRLQTQYKQHAGRSQVFQGYMIQQFLGTKNNVQCVVSVPPVVK